MKLKAAWINVSTIGMREEVALEQDVVNLVIIGPRGGTRAVEVLTWKQAKQLRDDLDKTLKERRHVD